MIFYGTSRELAFKPSNTKVWLDYLEKNDGKKLVIEVELEKGVRTSLQNRAMHKGFGLVAETLNNAGLDMKKVLKPEVDIPWTTESVKKFLFKPIQKIMTGKESTTELNKVSEIDETWEVMMRHLMEKHHIDYIPFPKKEKEEFKIESIYPENNLGETRF